MKTMCCKNSALLRTVLPIFLVPLIVTSLAAQAPEKPANPVTLDDHGTVHVPAQAVPQSAYLSPEAKAYVTQHLKDMQSPPPSPGGNGVPGFMQPYLDRQKILYPTVTSDAKIGGVHVVTYAPKEGISARNKDRVLIELHGGGFSGCWPGCAELEAMPIASLGRMKVVAVD
jgi:epsilon-lactone hydrolase